MPLHSMCYHTAFLQYPPDKYPLLGWRGRSTSRSRLQRRSQQRSWYGIPIPEMMMKMLDLLLHRHMPVLRHLDRCSAAFHRSTSNPGNRMVLRSVWPEGYRCRYCSGRTRGDLRWLFEGLIRGAAAAAAFSSSPPLLVGCPLA